MSLILSGTDGLSDVDGSAATPAIRGTDANTGIFFPAADTIAFSEGGTEAMRIDASGRVGIGTDSPATTLHLKAAVCNVRLEDADTSAYANVGVDNSGSMYLQADPANSQASSTMYFSIDGTERMRIDSSGNVGIGITSPACKLDLAGGSGTSQIAIRIRSLSTNSNGFNIITNSSTDDIYLNNHYSSAMLFGTNNTERARIDSSGNLLVGGTTSPTYGRLNIQATTGSAYANFGNDCIFYVCTGGPPNAAGTAMAIYRLNATGRSINAGGTINASGADYAEYMTKAGDFVIAKGDVVGINAQGKLTNVFADAVSFMVKSTDPSYVGGDTWGGEDKIGKRPAPDAPQEEQDAFEAALEAARQTVDRIAFAGQVPVNVTGATAGQYIVPVNDNGAIKGEAVNEADMTLTQYMKAVGKVIAIESDGRAKIIVKVA
jgi:hypothetical protein